MKNNKTNRRDFITKTTFAATGLSLGLHSITTNGTSSPGPNDKIRVGFIGVGNRGTQLLRLFMGQPDCEVAALCDIYEPYLQRDHSKVDRRYTEGPLGKGGQIPKMGEKFQNIVTRTMITENYWKIKRSMPSALQLLITGMLFRRLMQ